MTRQSPPIVPERGVPLTAETVVVPVDPDAGLLSIISAMVRRVAVPVSIEDEEIYFDNGHARQIYKAITDAAAPAREPEGGAVEELATQLARSIAGLGYPVGLGQAPSEADCTKAARAIITLYGAALTPKEAPFFIKDGEDPEAFRELGKRMADTDHEAPADPCADHKAEGFSIDPCCPHCEAPAEGAGEREGLIMALNIVTDPGIITGLRTAEEARSWIERSLQSALRARSSAPEAHEGEACEVCNDDGPADGGICGGCGTGKTPRTPSADKLRIAVEALEPFAAFARVAEAKSRMALGKVLPDNEIIASISWEGGLGVLVMGHLRDALTLVPDANGWGGIYRRSEALAALKAEGAK